ncbi:T9SS C-terminal target domain-containing protein [Sphingobacteriales bacterium UPWRP_1]|nr:hypothetical protein B6N25_09955 [Sphingobacteriales bacterium TSM_CSS]PSJ76386.1 T9SS C-terminal target domain-containing protein [Sphingobacteriales bacterium UPWRP_1]
MLFVKNKNWLHFFAGLLKAGYQFLLYCTEILVLFKQVNMKRTFLLFFILVVSAALIYNFQQHSKIARHTGEREGKEYEEHERGIAGALDYLNRRRADPVTGEVDIADVVRARKQADDMKLAKSGSSIIQWDFMGPNNIGGRTRAILIDPTNPNKMIAGAVSGGLWVSNDGGLNWSEHPQNRELPCLSISCIARASNGDIYVGTGEKIWNGVTYGNGDSGFAGCGIYKSTDGGSTFSLLESTIPALNSDTHRWAYIVALATHPTNPEWVYAATDRSFFMSTDGGETWVSPTGIPDLSGTCWDVRAASNGTIHVLISSKYFKSTDGMTFVEKSGNNLGNFPVYGENKKLAVSPTDPNYLYVVTTRTTGCLRQVLQSADAGETWVEIGAGGSEFFEPMSAGGTFCQGWYDLCIAVDPANKERIFIGGVDLWSWSAQDNWQQVGNWFPEDPAYPYYVHADKHTLVFHPTNPNILYIGNDGGIARTTNAGDLAPTFATLNRNYNVTQFYSVASGYDGRVIGGTQDNGTQYTTFNTDSYLSTTEAIGGDGGYTDVSKINPNIMFGAYVEGALYRSSNAGESFSGGFLDQKIDCQPLTTSGDCNSDGNVDGGPEFITPTVLWEDVDLNLAVYVTGSGDGKVWITLEALNVSTVPEWFNVGTFSGGGSGRLVTTVNVARDLAGKVMIIAGSQDGRVMTMRNVIVDEFAEVPQVAATNQITVKTIAANTVTGGLDQARYVTSVTVDPTNPQNMIVTMGNYGRNIYVFRSANALANNPVFESMQGLAENALPPMPVYDLILEKDNPFRAYAATEMGVWMCDIIQTGTTSFDYVWSEQNDGIGRVPVFRIRQEPIKYPSQQQGCNVLYIGTHGKGMYRSTTFTYSFCDVSLPGWGSGVGINTPSGNQPGIQVSPNPLSGNGLITISLPYAANQALVTIYNLNGQMVCRQTADAQTTGKQTLNIAASDFAPGAYLAVLDNGKERAVTKFVVK